MVNFSITQGLSMPIKKYLILSLLSLVIYSCANDSSSGPSALQINGQWNSNQYLYSPNCGEQQLTFDDYISYLITLKLEQDAQSYTNFVCEDEEEGWCDLPPADGSCELETNADCTYAQHLSTLQFQWGSDLSLTENFIAENTVITDVSDIQLNINNDNTYTISYEGTCVEYNDLPQNLCEALEDELVFWDGSSCDILTEEGCVLGPVGGIWDDGSSGVLDGDLDLYTMDDVNDDSLFEGNELNFDGSSISITVISTPELCVSLNFTK
tara:strand:- start:1705 stop:2508 length:804 start_codon:yes stop_codon:yes gene_type:complete